MRIVWHIHAMILTRLFVFLVGITDLRVAIENSTQLIFIKQNVILYNTWTEKRGQELDNDGPIL